MAALRYALIFCFALLFCWPINTLQATHIVGGELNYSCLGNNQYEITLTIYRDCFFGNPNAYFDDPASIGVFDFSNALVAEIQIPLMGDDTLSPVLQDECFVIPPSVCVHTTTYIDTITLLPQIGGYTLAYQRCCRNQTIENIIEPLATGATYMVEITERALLECNSSPKFQAWPPLYICEDQPIIFDQSAVDADGDSIFYRLCTPLTGADPDFPRPQPPNNPPYVEVIWNDPPYNVDNMLNGTPGSPPLAIDPQTGLLTGTPNTPGQFVVGICVEEYRDGELIGTLRRDFQYNVGQCSQATAAFFTPEVQCGDPTVNFLNQSVGTNDYLWIFGDPEDPDATSTEENPTYTYSDTGTYTITLIVEAEEACADTFQRDILLLPESLFPSFELDTLDCGEEWVVSFNSTSTDTLSEISSWEWTINGDSILMGPNQTFTFTEEGLSTILLTIESEAGCSANTLQAFSIELLEIPPIPDTLFLCPGESLSLYPGFNPNLGHSWSPATGLDDASAGNPSASPTENTLYQVEISDPLSNCLADRSVMVILSEAPALNVNDDFTTCDPEVELMVTTALENTVVWSSSIDFTTILAEGPTASLTVQNETTFYVEATNPEGCSSVDSVIVTGRAVDVAEPFEPSVCLGDAAGLALLNVDPSDELTYNWAPLDDIISQTSNGIIIRPMEAGLATYFVTVTNQFGCEFIDTLQVGVFDTTGLNLSIDFVQCAGYRVDFNTADSNGPLYQWHFGDPSQPMASGEGASVSHTYPGPGTYNVEVTIASNLDCVDTLTVPVVVTEPNFVPAFDYSLDDCSDQAATLQLTNESTHSSATIIDQEWIIDGIPNASSNPSLQIGPGESVEVILIVTSSDGCVDSLTEIITPRFIEADLDPVISNCNEEGVFLNPDGNPEYNYSWTPTNLVDDPIAINPFANPDTETAFIVTISDPIDGCEISDTVLVTIPEQLSYTLSEDEVTCGEEVTLTATTSAPAIILWASDPGLNNILQVGESFTTPPNTDGTIYVGFETVEGCQLLDSVLINDESINLSFDPAITICIGDSVELNVTGTNLNELSFDWSPLEGIISGANGPNPLVNPTVTTLYNFSAANSFGCTSTGTIQVNIFDFIPPLDVVPSQDTIVVGESIDLQATDDPNYTYEWSPGTGLDNTDQSLVTASPDETITYTVTIRDQSGCSNQAIVTLFVLNLECIEPFVYLPNAFSPNDDGLNDVLRVEGRAVDEVYLAIYDRWGELVFETRDPNEGWDGRFRDRDLPPDTYAYILEILCVDGERWQKQGNITLLR